jgi:mono/diheme cytochrome c family protein
MVGGALLRRPAFPPTSGIWFTLLRRTLLALLLGSVLCAPALAQEPPAAAAGKPAPAGQSSLDVPQLFATTCGWCHNGGGRRPGRGPQLMDTKRSDDFIRFRIKNGKEGAMPAFGSQFSDADIDRIIAYIRALKPE